MKWITKLILFLFILFLSTPTIVGFVDDNIDVSYFYNLAEEEENHVSFNEIKMVSSSSISFPSCLNKSKLNLNVSQSHFLSYDNLAHSIFSPPPNQI